MLPHHEKGCTMFGETNSELTFNLDEDTGVARIELLLRRAWVEVDSVVKDNAPDETLERPVVDHRFNNLPAATQVHAGDRCVDLREGSPDLLLWQPTAGKTDVSGGKPISIIAEPMDGNVLLDLHGDVGKGKGLIEPDRVLLNNETADGFIDVIVHLMFSESCLEFGGFSFCFQKLHLVLECDLKDLINRDAA